MMKTSTVTVEDVAKLLFPQVQQDRYWDQFMAEYVPQTPEFRFVRQMSQSLVRELFESAYVRWRIRHYMSNNFGVDSLQVATPAGTAFTIDRAWVEQYCQLPDLASWVEKVAE